MEYTLTTNIKRYFPPYTTSIYQPLDQGPISVVKNKYRNKMISYMIAARENFKEFQIQQGGKRNDSLSKYRKLTMLFRLKFAV